MIPRLPFKLPHDYDLTRDIHQILLQLKIVSFGNYNFKLKVDIELKVEELQYESAATLTSPLILIQALEINNRQSGQRNRVLEFASRLLDVGAQTNLAVLSFSVFSFFNMPQKKNFPSFY